MSQHTTQQPNAELQSQKAEDKLRYIQTLASKKRLHIMNEQIEDARDFAFMHKDSLQMMGMYKRMQGIEMTLENAIKTTYAEQMRLENKHPEFKQEAIDYAKRLEMTKAKSLQEGYGHERETVRKMQSQEQSY